MPPRSRPPISRALATGRACRCPNCGQGRLFSGWLKVRNDCSVCRLTFFPEPGYYVGAMYLNFIASALLLAVLYVIALPIHRFQEAAIASQVYGWGAVGVVVCLSLMRFAYSFWISLDFWLNPWEPGVEHPLG